MRVRFGAALASSVVISVGWMTVVGLLLAYDTFGMSEDRANLIQDITRLFLEIATIVIAMMVLLGVANLVLVHLRRTLSRRREGWYSVFVLVGLGAVVGAKLAGDEETYAQLLETVLIPVESALAGLVFFALVYGAYRMMRHRVSWSRTVFVLTVLIVLIGALPLSNLETARDFRVWLLETPVSAGARGLLLGIALATLVTGVRILVGVDRSYRQ